MSPTIELFPTPPTQPALSRRTLLALLVAAALHLLLLALPISFDLDRPQRAPILITIAQPPKPAETPVTETSPLEDRPPAEEAETIDIPPPANTAKEAPKIENPFTVPENTPPAARTADATVEQPAKPAAPEGGAKSRSTVFDPGLAKKLARERNKVRKFKAEDAEYRTTTGTFVQRGDRCWEVKQLISGDTSSESSQWLRQKCPKNSRSRSDIDRLARKYGIP